MLKARFSSSVSESPMMRTGSRRTLDVVLHLPGWTLWMIRTPSLVSTFWGAESAGIIGRTRKARIPTVAMVRCFMFIPSAASGHANTRPSDGGARRRILRRTRRARLSSPDEAYPSDLLKWSRHIVSFLCRAGQTQLFQLVLHPRLHEKSSKITYYGTGQPDDGRFTPSTVETPPPKGPGNHVLISNI